MTAFQFPPLQFLLENSRKYGDIFVSRVGSQRVYFINNSDYIKDVLTTHQSSFVKEDFLKRTKSFMGHGLLTSEGEFHRRQRRLAQPALHSQRIAACGDVMAEYAERAGSRWRAGQTFGIFQEMTRLTLGIVAKALFNADVEKDAQDVGLALSTIAPIFNLLAFPLSGESENLPLPQTRTFQEAKAKLDEIIYRLIQERRRSGEDAGDLLSMLILATDAEGGGERMSDEQLRDEAMTIFVAGHETVGCALTWTWYLLSQHPRVEEKLCEELDIVFADGRAPATRDLSRLPYTEKVFRETMRLYPPAWALGRVAIRDCEIGGRRIPKGSIVLMSQYVTHRDARYFPEPERFLPERWTEEAREALPPFAYFPFGGGARRCIGEQFAWMEGILVVAAIARRWRLRLAPNQQVEIQPVLTLRPKGEINMIAQQRSPT